METGLIYKIYHKRDYLNQECYIGQTVQTKKARWSSHKTASRAWEKKPSHIRDKETGKAAKLHRAMHIHGFPNMDIDILEEHECATEGELKNKLNERENFFIDHFNSIEKGWNKIYASKIPVAVDDSSDVKKTYEINGQEYQWGTISDIARNHLGLSYNSVRNRMKNHGEDAETAVKHCLNLQPQGLYEYGQQIYTIRALTESKTHNPNKVDKKSIEKRINKWRSSLSKAQSQLAVYYNEEKKQKVWKLPSGILVPVKKKAKHTITLSTGETITGNITKLYNEVVARIDELPELQEYIRVKGKYKIIETVNDQLSKRDGDGEPIWAVEEALGLKVPPNYRKVDMLIKEGYQYKPHKPVVDEGRHPVVIRSKNIIYISHIDFADAYEIPEHKWFISEKLKQGWTGEQILEAKGLTP